ncbi:MAG: DUF4396 domain-containing protein [Verrucomicrobiota bacterium]
MEGALILWYVLVGGSLVVLVWDLATNTPTGGVMKLAWVLVVLYTGPVGLVLFLLSCRQPLPGTHDEFIRPHWKQATGSLLHCVAGDATGIIVSAAIVSHFGLPNGVDLIIEYLSAFLVGLFVFQALFMLKMYQGNYWLAVRKTFFAETVSMNMVMVGMIPTMVILMHRVPGADSPYRLEFWGVMSLATLAGMVTAYPINSWMVAKGLKHGMMSAVPKPKGKEKEEMKMDGMDMGGHEDMEMGEMKMDMGEGQGEAHHHHHEAASLPKGKAMGILVGTFVLLLLVVWVTSRFVPIVF